VFKTSSIASDTSLKHLEAMSRCLKDLETCTTAWGHALRCKYRILLIPKLYKNQTAQNSAKTHKKSDHSSHYRDYMFSFVLGGLNIKTSQN